MRTRGFDKIVGNDFGQRQLARTRAGHGWTRRNPCLSARNKTAPSWGFFLAETVMSHSLHHSCNNFVTDFASVRLVDVLVM
jgi:hypothetical protein